MNSRYAAIVLLALALITMGCPSSGKVTVMGGDATERLDGSGRGDARGGYGELSAEDAMLTGDTGAISDTEGLEEHSPGPDVPVSGDTAADLAVPEGCCDENNTCPPNAICALPDHPIGGVCKEVGPEGKCWQQQDCPEDQTCLGALVCPCGANCDQEDTPGDCVPGTTDDLCCFADNMCSNGLHCVGGMPGGMPGTCVYDAPEGTCWEDEECAEGEACLEVKLCECSSGCLDPDGPIPGKCAVPACSPQSLDVSGLGMPCPTGLECAGFGADMCSLNVLSTPNLPAFCTMHCASELVDCGPDAFCLPMGYSSICVPNACYEPFVHTCNTDSQCKIASNWTQCCVCPEAVTTMEMELEKCMFEGTVPPSPFPLYCNNDCDGDEWCEECPSPLGVECKEHQCVFTAVQ